MEFPRSFWDTLRPLYRGNFSNGQFAGISAIVEGGLWMGLPIPHIAYGAATAHHETGRRMQPVREGFCSTNEGSIRAVTRLYQQGIIRTNYALPDPETGHSYYGRGLVQITWRDNYRKMGELVGIDLVNNPDLALDMEVSVKLLLLGSKLGMYRKGKSFSTMLPDDPPSFSQYVRARDIINGDVRSNGPRIARYAETFEKALRSI